MWFWWACKRKNHRDKHLRTKKTTSTCSSSRSTLQIRALGALCRVLSQVWRERIALAIPRLHKVWTKYAANLSCAELEEEKKNITGICFGLSVSHLLWISCLLRVPQAIILCFIAALTISDLITTNVLGGISEHVCSGSNGYFNWAASDIKSTTKTPDTASKRKPLRPTCSIKSQGQRESVSIGTGMTDLGGIGKTNSKQVYYIWRAIFTASTKRTQKVLYLTI